MSHAALLYFLFFLNGAMKGLALSVNKSYPFKSNNYFCLLFPEEHLFSIPSLLCYFSYSLYSVASLIFPEIFLSNNKVLKTSFHKYI